MPFITIQGEVPTGLDPFTTYQVYNCLDASVTAQLRPVMESKLNANHRTTYDRERRVMALCLEMSTKGLPIDQMALAELLYQLEKDQAKALRILHRFCVEGVGYFAINPNSPPQVAGLFYTYLGLPPIHKWDRQTKERKVTTDIKALEKLRDGYPIAVPLVNAILSFRESSKMASVFKRGLEPTRSVLRCSFSPSGTETGRLSSQQNPYNRGTNAQNLTDRVRQGITAPDGYAILNLDLKTAESIGVGFASGCQAYIDACLSGDVHTAACRLNWPHLAWTGDLEHDKELAEGPYYRMFSYRDLMKKGGHGTNYFGQPRTIAQVALGNQVPISVVADFQRKYYEAFPEIKDWQLETIARVQMDGILVTPLGRERRFWGRPDDAATHREAIAFVPQSIVADVMNEGLIQIQEYLMRECRAARMFVGRSGRLFRWSPDAIDLRAQVHDAGVFLIPIDALDTLAPVVQRKLEYPVDFGKLGTMLIPSDMTVGRRWNKAPKKGATLYTREGLKPWKPGQPLHWL